VSIKEEIKCFVLMLASKSQSTLMVRMEYSQGTSLDDLLVKVRPNADAVKLRDHAQLEPDVTKGASGTKWMYSRKRKFSSSSEEIVFNTKKSSNLSNASEHRRRKYKLNNKSRRGSTKRCNIIDESSDNEDESFDFLEILGQSDSAPAAESAQDLLSRTETVRAIESEIEKLPGRQREAFLLRYWEELDVSETAAAMGCSEGSVKTHCSRAIQALHKALTAKGLKP
jgi:RNA polymerase sigma factor (sigma-70 family)